jgi:hypothetical protein
MGRLSIGIKAWFPRRGKAWLALLGTGMEGVIWGVGIPIERLSASLSYNHELYFPSSSISCVCRSPCSFPTAGSLAKVHHAVSLVVPSSQTRERTRWTSNAARFFLANCLFDFPTLPRDCATTSATRQVPVKNHFTDSLVWNEGVRRDNDKWVSKASKWFCKRAPFHTASHVTILTQQTSQ